MAFKVSLSLVAEIELREAIEFYNNNSNRIAKNFYTEFLERKSHISKHPTAQILIISNIRRAVFLKFPYSIFYEIHKNEIIILSIFHNKRKPINWETTI